MAGWRQSPDTWKVRSSALLIVLATVLVAGCATTGRVARPAPTPSPFPGANTLPAIANPVSSPASSLMVQRLLQTALAMQGIPYRSGGENPSTGFDCSGFVRWVFSDQGIDVPRTVREQFAYGRRIADREIQPGDLLFFSTESSGATHVGIAIDAANAPATTADLPFIHAPGENGVVRIEALGAPYWRSRFVGARRLF